MQQIYERLDQAARMAKWLIEEKGKLRKTAYIIAQRKYKLPDYNMVRQAYHKIMRKQLELL